MAAGFAVTNGIQEISPSSYAGSISTSTDTVVLTGSDLEPGATVTVTGCAEITGAFTLVSATGNSATVSFPSLGTAAQACTIHYANPAVGGDGLTYCGRWSPVHWRGEQRCSDRDWRYRSHDTGERRNIGYARDADWFWIWLLHATPVHGNGYYL